MTREIPKVTQNKNIHPRCATGDSLHLSNTNTTNRKFGSKVYLQQSEEPTGVGDWKCLPRFMTFPSMVMRTTKSHTAIRSTWVSQIGTNLISFPSQPPRKVYTAIILWTIQLLWETDRANGKAMAQLCQPGRTRVDTHTQKWDTTHVMENDTPVQCSTHCWSLIQECVSNLIHVIPYYFD